MTLPPTTSTATSGSISSSSTSSSTSSPPLTFTPSVAALQTGDIRTYIRVVLDLQNSNYSEWSHLFMVHLGRCGLHSHVNGDEPDHDIPVWAQEDFIVLQWLYTSITKELFHMVVWHDATAYDIWISLEALFRNNKPSRIVHLEAEFRSAVQGDQTVSAYCQRLKSLADSLADIGHTISDQTLVLTLLRELNDKFSVPVSMIPLLRPFPTFLEARSILMLEELNQAAKVSSATALVSAGRAQPATFHNSATGHGSTGARTSFYSTGSSNSNGTNWKGKGKVKPNTNRTAPPSTVSNNWRPQSQPWTGMVQAWPLPWSGLQRPTGGPGLLGPHPPQVYTSFVLLYQPSPAALNPYPVLHYQLPPRRRDSTTTAQRANFRSSRPRPRAPVHVHAWRHQLRLGGRLRRHGPYDK